jgi:hypothetical protein
MMAKLRILAFAELTTTDTMDGMTEEEMEFCQECYESGLEAEDIFERLNEQVPYGQIVWLLNTYEDRTMSGIREAYY